MNSTRDPVETISTYDRQILRDLASRYAELCCTADNDRLKQLWRCHNSLRQERPMLVFELEPAIWSEFAPEPRCHGEHARRIEWGLNNRIWHCENIADDSIHEPVYHLGLKVQSTGSGIQTERLRSGEAGGSVAFGVALEPGDDPQRIALPQIQVDHDASHRERDEVQEIFGSALRVDLVGNNNPWFTPLDTLAQWRGVQNLMMDLMDAPDWVHGVCDRLLKAQLTVLDQLEEQQGLSANTGPQRVGSGGLGVSDDLAANVPMKATQMWGMAAAQVFSEVSPAMHEEFCLTYERQWLARFGLACYGCCEALHNKVDILRRIPNLRRISMSPWVDMAVAAEAIGRDYIFSRKPNPAILAGETWNPGAARAAIRDDLEKAVGCNIEFIMRTCRTCRNEPQRIIAWTRIAREELGIH